MRDPHQELPPEMEEKMDAKTEDNAGKCPVVHHSFTNRDWWPSQLDVQV